jgi:hypothetical protein
MLMQIHSNESYKEFCIIELQGEIHHEAGLKQGFCVGTLSAHADNADTIFLQVGYHRLEGHHVPLKNPIALLKRRYGATGQQDEGCDEDGMSTAFYVHAQIRSKYIFKSRPKALVSQVS